MNVFRPVKNADFSSPNGLLLKLLDPVHFLIQNRTISLEIIFEKKFPNLLGCMVTQKLLRLSRR